MKLWKSKLDPLVVFVSNELSRSDAEEISQEEYKSVLASQPPTPPSPPPSDESKVARKIGRIILELSKESSAAMVLTKLKTLVQEALDDQG